MTKFKRFLGCVVVPGVGFYRVKPIELYSPPPPRMAGGSRWTSTPLWAAHHSQGRTKVVVEFSDEIDVN
jgi:hypothetical protein